MKSLKFHLRRFAVWLESITTHLFYEKSVYAWAEMVSDVEYYKEKLTEVNNLHRKIPRDRFLEDQKCFIENRIWELTEVLKLEVNDLVQILGEKGNACSTGVIVKRGEPNTFFVKYKNYNPPYEEITREFYDFELKKLVC